MLAARPSSCVAGLKGYREGKAAEWCASFAGACERAASLSIVLATQIRDLGPAWYERAGRPRRDAAAARIIGVLPTQPIASATTMRAAIGAFHGGRSKA